MVARWGIGAVAGVLLAGLVAPVATQAADDAGRCRADGGYEVCLTRPDRIDGGVDLSIVEKLREYVASTGSGDRIRGAMYLWQLDGRAPDTEGLIDDLAAATARGVDVALVVGDPAESGAGEHPNNAAIAKLRAHDIPVTVCGHSCLPNADGDLAGNMHLKFFAFQRGDTVQVAHTSSNLTVGQYRRHQNLLSVTGDTGLYDDYLGFWRRMAAGSWTDAGETWDDSQRVRDGSTPGVRSYFFPRETADPVARTLSRLTCRPGHDRVWVVASLFDRSGVLEQLDSLAANGCDVRVVVAEPNEYRWVTSESALTGVRLLDDGTDGTYLSHHNKLIVTDADYDGAEHTMVLAGSHNLHEVSLHDSSDAMLEVDDPWVYQEYADYAETLYGLGSKG